MEHYWMDTWIEGRIKGREERKEPRKWVKEQQGKRCQCVISPRDWTKREGRVPFSRTPSHSVLDSLCRQHVCVCIDSHTQCTRVLCNSAVLTFMYLQHAPLGSNFNNQPLQQKCVCRCEGIYVCAGVWMHACVWHALLQVGVFLSLYIRLLDIGWLTSLLIQFTPIMEIDLLPFPHTYTTTHPHLQIHALKLTLWIFHRHIGQHPSGVCTFYTKSSAASRGIHWDMWVAFRYPCGETDS